MEVTTDQLLVIIGAKEVEIYLLKQRVAVLENALKKLPPPAEAPQ